MSPQEVHDIYERVVRDLGETTWRFDRWWVEATRKYRLNGYHEIDFETGNISKTATGDDEKKVG
jgi:CXXX repeat modification system protein